MKTMSFVAFAAIVATVMAFPLRADSGAELYKEHCAVCHGDDGKARPRSDLTSASVQEKSDRALVTFIADGRRHEFSGRGPRASQMQFIVDHLRTLPSRPAPASTETPEESQDR
jgi:mono/diheme cytochrome c family protein